jgi:hypothetical protein
MATIRALEGLVRRVTPQGRAWTHGALENRRTTALRVVHDVESTPRKVSATLKWKEHCYRGVVLLAKDRLLPRSSPVLHANYEEALPASGYTHVRGRTGSNTPTIRI